MNSIAFWTLETFAVQLIVRWVLGLAQRPDHSAHLLPRAARAHRFRAAVRGDLFDAAADLRRHHSARATGLPRSSRSSPGSRSSPASHTFVWRAASAARRRSGRLAGVRIDDLLSAKRPTFSFEFMAPRSDSEVDALFQTVSDLARLHPDFVCVTCRPSSRDRTIDLRLRFGKRLDLVSMAHLICIGTTREEIGETLDRLDVGGRQKRPSSSRRSSGPR